MPSRVVFQQPAKGDALAKSHEMAKQKFRPTRPGRVSDFLRRHQRYHAEKFVTLPTLIFTGGLWFQSVHDLKNQTGDQLGTLHGTNKDPGIIDNRQAIHPEAIHSL